MAKQSKRPLAVIVRRRLSRIGDFIKFVRAVVKSIGDNATIFVTPDPPLTQVTTDTNKLDTAEAKAATRVKGAAAERDIQYDLVWDDLNGLVSYVQRLADNATDEPTAISIIQAAGLVVKSHGVRVKPLFDVRLLPVSGSLKLVAKSHGRASYEWQESTNGVDWSTVSITLQGHAVINGRTPGTKLYYRMRAITKEGAMAWSYIISIIVE